MSEPTLKDIGDYNTLRGEKKRVVIAVILAGLIIGAAFGVAKFVYDGPADSIDVKQSIRTMPVK